jgi:hypothetical protein
MKKIVGYLTSWGLYLVGVILVSPIVLALLLFGLANKVTCWANKKHTYDYKLVASGWTFDKLVCSKCAKPISGGEIARVRAEFDVWLASLYQTKNLLNTILKSPEEAAVDNIIEETKSG